LATDPVGRLLVKQRPELLPLRPEGEANPRIFQMISLISANTVMNIKRRWPLVVSALAILAGLHAPLSSAADIYGEAYQKVESVVEQQARVVMYRGDDHGKQAAHVYIDGQLQSALMPGGYTVFCTPVGEHSLESYIGDAPLYTGKRNPQSFASFKGGRTYVLEANIADGQSTPVVRPAKDAEQYLQGKRRQIHVLSRAASAVPCQSETRLTLRSDVLFNFGKSGYQDLTVEGRAMLVKAVADIKQERDISRIEVVGHADPIGQAKANQQLSQRRAETVRKFLLDQGIQSQLVEASGRGSAEPVVQCSAGKRSEQVACNAPNRRVELIIQKGRD
jgi:OOP family OmpA-OmpF porin